MRIAVTGGGGLLGGHILDGFAGDRIDRIDRRDLSLLDVPSTRRLLAKIEPDILIHAAANTDVERCEVEPDSAYRDNVLLTLLLASACVGTDIKMVYFSSTGVYGGWKTSPYTEFDHVEPTTVHHKAKLAGEQEVERFVPNHLIVRTGWLFGGGKRHGRDFVVNRYKEARHSASISCNDRQVGNPTYAGDVVRQLKIMLETDMMGTFNCVSPSPATRCDYVRAILRRFDLPCEVIPKTNFQRVALVSSNESAANYKLELIGADNMPDWKSSLDTYIDRLKDELEEGG